MPYRHEINTDKPFDIYRAPTDLPPAAIEIGNVVIPPPPGRETPAHPQMRPVEASAQQTLEKMIFEKSYHAVQDVSVYRCECQRCPKIWFTLQQTPPKTCPACRSAWWNRPKSVNMHPPSGENVTRKRKKSKSKRGPIVPGRGPGRPRKYAIREVLPMGGVEEQMAREADLPEVTMELLGAVGGLGDAPSQSNAGAAAADEENFPVPTPLDDRPPVSHAPPVAAHTPVPTGQPADGRISPPVADTGGYKVGADLTLKPEAAQDTTGVEPPPVPPWPDDFDDWHPS